MRKEFNFAPNGTGNQPASPQQHPDRRLNIIHSISKKQLCSQIIAHVDNLPPLPTVVAQLLKLLQDDNTTALQVEELLKQDPTLAARILRLVNSAFFALRNKISSIPHAVVLLGYKTIKNLVLAASVYKLVNGAFPGYGYKEAGLWHHSVMTANWSEKLAKLLGWPTEEVQEIFVVGLLHDIGKIVMSTYVGEHVKDMISCLLETKGDLVCAEQNLIGVDHAEIGARIAEKWNFPDNLSHIINKHHEQETGNGHYKETALIQLVDYMINKKHIGMYDNFPIDHPLPSHCLDILGIYGETFTAIQDQIDENTDKLLEQI